ncbi:MAG: alanine--glyoxylate aminotransferase family protein [Armatimonadota bacterium]
MASGEPLLMIPGPTNLPPEVRAALGGPGFYHRGPQMAELLARCSAGLRDLMGLTGDVLILTSSGTGAVEAVITNFLSPGDRVLAVLGGKFGERMGEIASAFGAEVRALAVEPGRAVRPDDLAAALAQAPCRAVLCVHNETSTGVTHPIAEVAATAHAAGALTIVDCVSCLGGVPVCADRWGLDVVAAGSQKCLMLPPGLAFAGVRDEVWEATADARMPRFYFDLRRARAALRKGQTPYTPATNLIAALAAALDLIEAEGLERVFARHRAMAEATRAAMRAGGLRLFAEEGSRSDTVTAVHSPAGIDSSELVRLVRERHDVVISGGQDALKGRIFRIGHMGLVRLEQIERTLQAVADELTNLGYRCDAGAMLTAAHEAAQAAGTGAS